MPGGLHPPLSVIATWPTPNYVNPQSRGKALLVVTLTFGILTILTVIARLWVRLRLQKKPGLDDVFLALALIPAIGITSLFILIETKFRWHRHIWDAPLTSLAGREYHSWVVQLLFVFSTSFSKISTLLLYRRVISGSSNRKSIWVVNSAVGALIVYAITFLFLMVFQCRPTDAYWGQFSFPKGYGKEFSCLYEGNVPMANAIVSVVTDFLTAILPMFLFWQLQLPIREKLALGMLFGVGFIVCLIGIVRTVIIHRIFYETYDVTWVSRDLWIWLNTESDLLIICSAVPPLRALFKKFFHSRPSKSSQNSRRLIHFNRSSNNYQGLADPLKDRASDEDVELYGTKHSSSTVINTNGSQTSHLEFDPNPSSKESGRYTHGGVMREISVVVDYQRQGEALQKMA